MADDILRLEFEERDQQWFIVEVHRDGSTQPGEPFPASGHKDYSKLQQVLSRIKDKYSEYRPSDVPYDAVNRTRYVLSIARNEAS